MPAKTLGEALYRSTINGGLEELLRYSDRNSMAHSREVRLPFLSHKLVEFVFSLPAEYKIRNGVTKFIMRQAFSDLLPPAILDRRDKIGYEPPQSDWLNNDSLRSLLGEYQDAMRKDNILSDKFDLDLNSTQIDSAIAWKVMMAGMLMKK